MRAEFKEQQPLKNELWIGLAWVKPLPEKPNALDGDAGAFVNVVTWASDESTYKEKVETIAAACDVYLVEIEGSEPVAVRKSRSPVSEEIEDLIARAEGNPSFILYGTFHHYLHEDA